MRSYEDACGITRALDAVGERWALPVVRELVFGPRRYSDLAAALPGVSTNILGTRLKDLTETGVVGRRRLPPPAPSTVYELTPWGAALEPTLIALGRWAAHTPVDLAQQTFSASSFALSLKTTFDPRAARGVDVAVRLVMGADVFDAHIHEAEFTIARAVAAPGIDITSDDPPAGIHARIHADPKTLAALIYQRLDPTRAAMQGEARIDGSSALIATFASCFALPQPPTKGPS